MARWNLLRTLGIVVALDPPAKEEQLSIMNQARFESIMCGNSDSRQVWGVVMKYKDVPQYISCAEAWIEYPVKYFGIKEVHQISIKCHRHKTRCNADQCDGSRHHRPRQARPSVREPLPAAAVHHQQGAQQHFVRSDLVSHELYRLK